MNEEKSNECVRLCPRKGLRILTGCAISRSSIIFMSVPDGEIFVKYGLGKNSSAEIKAPTNEAGKKILAKLEKNIALLRTVI